MPEPDERAVFAALDGEPDPGFTQGLLDRLLHEIADTPSYPSNGSVAPPSEATDGPREDMLMTDIDTLERPTPSQRPNRKWWIGGIAAAAAALIVVGIVAANDSDNTVTVASQGGDDAAGVAAGEVSLTLDSAGCEYRGPSTFPEGHDANIVVVNQNDSKAWFAAIALSDSATFADVAAETDARQALIEAGGEEGARIPGFRLNLPRLIQVDAGESDLWELNPLITPTVTNADGDPARLALDAGEYALVCTNFTGSDISDAYALTTRMELVGSVLVVE